MAHAAAHGELVEPYERAREPRERAPLSAHPRIKYGAGSEPVEGPEVVENTVRAVY